ncbi:AfsR/SARP family transcriptional regulator [Saccharothrix lopnurensis]|uniref:BTAD domain-containing putative transcriptional regulator n=1 Tax=Saccharothrix lopnurensis TaxID=1670621 RepID=A0ABW1P9E4_9PSEU
MEVLVDGRALDLGHAVRRHVLGVLAADANTVVTADRLADRVWGHRRPPGSRSAVYSYVSRLRHVLAPVRGLDLVRRSGGYVLEMDPAVGDLHALRAAFAGIRAGTPDEDDLRTALDLWGGDALPALDSPWADDLRAAARRQRLTVLHVHADLALAAGEHDRVAATLARHTAENPLDERLAAQYMLAAHRTGRRTEALAHYDRFRRHLAEVLGIGPCQELRHLHQVILTSDQAGRALDPSHHRAAHQ